MGPLPVWRVRLSLPASFGGERVPVSPHDRRHGRLPGLHEQRAHVRRLLRIQRRRARRLRPLLHAIRGAEAGARVRRCRSGAGVVLVLFDIQASGITARYLSDFSFLLMFPASIAMLASSRGCGARGAKGSSSRCASRACWPAWPSIAGRCSSTEGSRR